MTARGERWVRAEVEATVASYFQMLRSELEGKDYNKSAHRRQLRRALGDRSEGSIERKHQNISAVLIELGFPYIDGYKPLSNYQALLRRVVAERLAHSSELAERVAEEVERDIDIPDVEDILQILVEPPDRPSPSRYARERPAPASGTRPNYLLQEIRNASLGKAGERFVLNYERARLIAAGKDSLAADIDHVAETRGDQAGFDILSFETSGADRLIEVKTTGFGRYTPFFVTANELAVSRRKQGAYHLYRVFKFRKAPRLFMKKGSLNHEFDLEPSQFMARVV